MDLLDDRWAADRADEREHALELAVELVEPQKDGAIVRRR
jgi:hypothetical protein